MCQLLSLIDHLTIWFLQHQETFKNARHNLLNNRPKTQNVQFTVTQTRTSSTLSRLRNWNIKPLAFFPWTMIWTFINWLWKWLINELLQLHKIITADLQHSLCGGSDLIFAGLHAGISGSSVTEETIQISVRNSCKLPGRTLTWTVPCKLNRIWCVCSDKLQVCNQY